MHHNHSLAEISDLKKHGHTTVAFYSKQHTLYLLMAYILCLACIIYSIMDPDTHVTLVLFLLVHSSVYNAAVIM